ncbi:MAG: alanine dehydrogenase [Spongiibacteraceae bacterium]
MLIGVPKEIKDHEYRVGLSPASAKELIAAGHQILIETNAGRAIGFDNQQYLEAGADIIATPEEIFARAEMIVKVKEPQAHECLQLRPKQVLYTFLHLAPDPKQTALLIASGATCIAYETVTDQHGGLPLLAPMSEVAGRMSIQAAAHHLEKTQGGSGLLLGGVPGVAPAKVLILGGGVVGSNAAKIAIGMGADVTVLDLSLARLRELDDIFGSQLRTIYSTKDAIDSYSAAADVIIGSVLIPGAAAPKLIRKAHLARMKPGSVIVDVAIDQGGCFETSKPTTHQQPTYVVDNIVHYCVTNMPGGVARTATLALNNATLPFALNIANKGAEQAMRDDKHLLNGLNIYNGIVTCRAVAESLNHSYTEALTAINS